MTQPASTCILIGEESLLIQCAQTLLDRGQKVVGILTADPAIAAWATEREIPTACSRGNLLDFVSAREFDYLFSVANLRMLPAGVISRARKMAINFHDGPLPAYAGVYVTTWAILNGETEHGVTWHEMTPEADRGRLLLQKRFEISDNETAFSLNARCFEAAMETFTELADQIREDRLEPVEQDFSSRSYFGRRERPENGGLVDLGQPASDIERTFRAFEFGAGYPNPLSVPKILVGERPVLVRAIEVLESSSDGEPGTVTAVDTAEQKITVTTGSEDVTLSGFLGPRGEKIPVEELSLHAGDRLGQLSETDGQGVTALHRGVGPAEERWMLRLAGIVPLDIPLADRGSSTGQAPAWSHSVQELSPAAVTALEAASAGDPVRGLLVALGTYLGRLCGQPKFSVGYRHPALVEALGGMNARFFSDWVPLEFDLDLDRNFRDSLATQGERIEAFTKDLTFARDIQARFPSLGTEPPRYAVALEVDPREPGKHLPEGCELALSLSSDGKTVTWTHDPAVFSSETVERLGKQLTSLLESLGDRLDSALSRLPLLGPEELERVLHTWNDTEVEYDASQTMHGLFEARVRSHPDRIALHHENQSLTYRQLDERANQLAHYLREQGVGPDSLVGVATGRDLDMIVAVFGVLKAGGAYVPLDPEYPSDRIAFMIEDAKISILLTQQGPGNKIPSGEARVVHLDSDWDSLIGSRPTEAPEPTSTATDLAYVIYTSGSTGKPKGVMVEHRNAVNFFVGMDDCIPHDPPGTWLTVTSLSFDISVLEIFWTLSRGFEVIIYGGGEKVDLSRPAEDEDSLEHEDRPLDFSLFYFSSDEGEKARDKYRLLLDGARFADAHGFTAIWTPERHFHAFGGLYPNPSVTSAALATITRNVRLRAGSCVLPLHSPIRVAEEWSLVDNLSEGRVEISFASGWQPNDFVFFPENYERRKEVMFEQMDQVQKLWQGEALKFRDGTGQEIEIQTLPRPVQEKLPIFVTAAGNPETFRAAGERGEKLLTHLLGQSPEEVTEKIKVYREAWEKAGHPGRGHVALMLHTFIGTDEAEVKEIVREPMKEYLKSSVMLIQKAAWSFPTFKQKTTDGDGRFSLDNLSGEQLDEVLDFSFERYYETSGLFGTVESTRKFVDSVKGCDVDEIACLIDFGVSSDLALEALPLLDEVKNRANEGTLAPAASSDSEGPSTIARLIERHGVTHLQCTPSMASMLLLSEEEKKALAKIRHLFVGGEALPPTLAEGLRAAMPSGTIRNMYGPTETTIWSSTRDVTEAGPITIGTPIANTQIYILDAHLELVPPGVPGELCIGGDGVVRGYLDRPELTAERFVPDRFHTRPGMKLYRTGDLARHGEDGVLEFISRMDHQVKVRGYRIELGEIESLLGRHAEVRECVVIAREDSPGDRRLVAYFLPASGRGVDVMKLRNHLRQTLPEFMVPSAFVELDRFPLTPNLKVDRKALPAPSEVRPATTSSADTAPPSSELEKTIAGIWEEVLALPGMGLDDNFFDLGGHSLLTLQVHTRLKEVVETRISLVDMFKYPTIRTLAGFIAEEASGGSSEKLRETTEKRAQSRRDAMSRRRGSRGRKLQNTDRS